VQDIRNEAWNLHQSLPLDAVLLASGVAQGQVPHDWAADEATLSGVNGTRFNHLVDVFNTGPGVGQAFHLLRRQKIDPAGFKRALKREGIEDEWIDALALVVEEVLDPADLARGIHRGLVPDPGLLRGTLPSGVGHVEAYPVYPIDALKEAQAAGFDRDHLGVLVGLQGNPMGAHEAAQAQFRGVLTNDDYLRAIAEGNTRNEWADPIREQSRAIPSVTNYVEARVRGWINDAEMYAGTARHGMTKADTDTEFLIHGRPLSWHQVFIGLRRGGKMGVDNAGIDPAFLKALQESNIRPEWYQLAWAQRYSYPAAFVLRGLTEAGDVTEAEAEQILLFEGWEPTLAAKVSKKWTTKAAAAGKVDPLVSKAETKLFTVTQKAYTEKGITKAEAVTALDHLTTDAAVQAKVFEMWDASIVVLFAPPPPAAP